MTTSSRRNVVLILEIVTVTYQVACRWRGCLHSSDHTDRIEANTVAALHHANHKLAGRKSPRPRAAREEW